MNMIFMLFLQEEISVPPKLTNLLQLDKLKNICPAQHVQDIVLSREDNCAVGSHPLQMDVSLRTTMQSDA